MNSNDKKNFEIKKAECPFNRKLLTEIIFQQILMEKLKNVKKVHFGKSNYLVRDIKKDEDKKLVYIVGEAIDLNDDLDKSNLPFSSKIKTDGTEDLFDWLNKEFPDKEFLCRLLVPMTTIKYYWQISELIINKTPEKATIKFYTHSCLSGGVISKEHYKFFADLITNRLKSIYGSDLTISIKQYNSPFSAVRTNTPLYSDVAIVKELSSIFFDEKFKLIKNCLELRMDLFNTFANAKLDNSKKRMIKQYINENKLFLAKGPWYKQMTNLFCQVDAGEEVELIDYRSTGYTNTLLRISKLAVPFYLRSLIGQLDGFLRNIMLAQLGHTGLAAASVAVLGRGAVSAIQASFIRPLRVLVAHYDAANDKRSAGEVLMLTWIIQILLSIPLGLALVFLYPKILLRFGYKQNTIDAVSAYIVPYAFSMIPTRIVESDLVFLSAINKERVVVWWTGLLVMIGALLNYSLILGNFGAPRLETKGWGLATVAQMTLGLGLFKIYFVLSSDVSRYVLVVPRMRHLLKHLQAILKLSLPILMFTLVQFPLIFSANAIMENSGEINLELDQVRSTYTDITIEPIAESINTATEILIARAAGAFQFNNIKQIFRTSLFLEAGLTLIPLAAYSMLAPQLAGVFLDQSEIRGRESYIRIAFVISALSNVASAVSNVNSSSLGSLYDTLYPALVNILVGCAVMLPLTYLFAYVLDWGLPGVYAADLLGNTAMSALLSYRWAIKSRQYPMESLNVISNHGVNDCLRNNLPCVLPNKESEGDYPFAKLDDKIKKIDQENVQSYCGSALSLFGIFKKNSKREENILLVQSETSLESSSQELGN